MGNVEEAILFLRVLHVGAFLCPFEQHLTLTAYQGASHHGHTDYDAF